MGAALILTLAILVSNATLPPSRVPWDNPAVVSLCASERQGLTEYVDAEFNGVTDRARVQWHTWDDYLDTQPEPNDGAWINMTTNTIHLPDETRQCPTMVSHELTAHVFDVPVVEHVYSGAI
jgi:hypothetical protein